MTGHIPRPEILTEPQRRRRWSPAEKLAMVEATYEPGVTVSLVARRNGIQPNQLFAWRKLAAQGALTATSARGRRSWRLPHVAPCKTQVRELQRLLGKKATEAEILKEAFDVAAPKKRPLRMLSRPGKGSR